MEPVITEAEATRRRKARLLLAVKLPLTLLLCGVLVWKADWSGVADAIRHTSPYVVVVAFVLMMLSVAISAYKWQMLLEIHGVRFSFSLLHRYYFIAGFFNNFLPTSIGGDGYRIYKTLDNSRSRSSAVIAVVMERLTGIVALLLIGYVCGIVVFLQQRDALSQFIAMGGSIGLAVAIPLMFLVWKWGWLGRLRHSDRMPAIVKSVLDHLGDYATRPRKTRNMMLLSFFFQIHNSMAFYVLLVYGVEAPISIPQLLVVLTLVNVIAVMPISINGIGVVDGSFIYLTSIYGVPYDAALAVMLINRALLIIISAIGAVLYFSDRGEEVVVSP